MDNGEENEERIARQGRIASIVIAATMVLWMTAQWIGGKFGLEARWVFLFDLVALAGLTWALIVTWQVWRNRRGG